MKAGWEIKKLGEVCEMYQPKTISTKDMIEDGPYPVYGANGIIGRYDQFNHSDPQLLVTCRGATCGAVNISQPKSWITGNAMVIQPKHNNLALKFLEYLFRGGLDISKAITGAAQPQITRTNLNPLTIPVPPLSEQAHIVGILDEAFASIATAKANTQKNLENAKAVFESHLNSVFSNRGEGWVEKKLGEVCDFEGGSQPPKSNFIYEPKDGYTRFLQIRDFGTEKHATYIPDSKKNRLCSADDILIGRYGASVGKILTGKAGAYNVALMRTEPELELLNKGWFHNYLLSNYFQHSLMKVADRSAQNGFSKDDIYNFPVPIPALAEQETIVCILDSLKEETSRLTSLYTQKLSALEDLKKSLLHQAFTGKL